MKYKKIEFEKFLATVNIPSRYIDHELNAFRKPISEQTINFCLAFPDVYEVGVSHLGLKILYTILNEEKDTVADRTYAPWPDFLEKMNEYSLPLFGVESKIAVRDFDVLGFTLQSELTFSNVLLMLDLAKIPLIGSERTEEHPIVIAGGPSASNPEPLSDFMDAFLIGEGEEAIIDIKNCLKETKNLPRKDKLFALSQIEGVYVPSLYKEEEGRILPIEDGVPKVIKIRKFMKFSDMEKYHKNQLVSWQEATHDRYVAEIMRGCSHGCRFCHAGMFYRPVRERDTDKIVDALVKEVKANGWDEAALVSLSSSDYTYIKPLLFKLYKELEGTNTSLSLPSLRVDSLDQDLVGLMNAVRQTGLTIAPEAGSQRMRDIINKNISEEEIMEGVKIALANGWKVIKLYFMIGLPFETDEDIEAIAELVKKIVGISNKRIRINITISPFVPKPFTPFQWAGMKSREYMLDKVYMVKRMLARYKFIKVKYHTVELSMLEGVITRGDRKISKLIYEAYKNGAKFDGWNEHFQFSIWEKAAEDLGINFEDYLREKDVEEDLFWDHINIKVTKEFLKKDWLAAKALETIPDCRVDVCTLCGMCDSKIKPIYAANTFKVEKLNIPEKIEDNSPKFHYRVYFSKVAELQFVAHLDFHRMIQRLLKAADLPVAFSQGFSPHAKLSVGPPLSIGVQGLNEFFDIALTEFVDKNEMFDKLKAVFPHPLGINGVDYLGNKKANNVNDFNIEELKVVFPKEFEERIKIQMEKWNNSEKWIYSRTRKGKIKEYDLKEIVEIMILKQNVLLIKKKLIGGSFFNVAEEVFGFERNDLIGWEIIRTNILMNKKEIKR